MPPVSNAKVTSFGGKLGKQQDASTAMGSPEKPPQKSKQQSKGVGRKAFTPSSLLRPPGETCQTLDSINSFTIACNEVHACSALIAAVLLHANMNEEMSQGPIMLPCA